MSMEATAMMFTYLGGKRRMLAPLSHLIPPDCTVYAEPFCGSAALALNCRKFDTKILNDFNPGISNFWRVATSLEYSKDLLTALQKTQYSRSLFMQAKERREQCGSKRTDLVQWAVDTYILIMQSFNATGDNWVLKSSDGYTNNLNHPTKIPLAFKLLEGQKFRVYNTTAIDCLAREKILDNPNAFIFPDPPYLEGLRCDGKLYQTDMPDTRNHIDLLKAIMGATAKIVLSGYWSGRDDGTDLYDYYLLAHGWHRHLLGEYTKSCQTGETKSAGAEWVWTNYNLAQEAPASLACLKSYCDDEKSPCLKEWTALHSIHHKGRAAVC